MSTYETWDAERRETFDSFESSYDLIEVVHGEHETAVYYGSTSGYVVAGWCQATGHSHIKSVSALAEMMANGVRNYITNAYEDGS